MIGQDMDDIDDEDDEDEDDKEYEISDCDDEENCGTESNDDSELLTIGYALPAKSKTKYMIILVTFF